MTRKQAYAAGKHKYYTSKPCIRGHDSLRYVNTGACIDCISSYSKRYRGKKAPFVEVIISLRSEKDEGALRKYADALNFDRELQDISEGKL